jgi:hypothetical protein
MTSHITTMLWATAATAAVVIGVAPATAEDTVKLAYVDPLSGGGASIGEVGLKTFNPHSPDDALSCAVRTPIQI